MNRLVTSVVALALAVLGTSSWAGYTGEPDALLTDQQVAELPEAARGSYNRAVQAFDHIDRDSGVEQLSAAAKAAPDYIPLQFVLASRARDRARFHYGVRALEYYDLSEEALQRILKQSVLTLEQRRRVDQMLKTVQDERDTLPAKERKKLETGFQSIVLPLAQLRAERMGAELTPTDVNAAIAQSEGGQPGATTPGPAVGTAPVEQSLPLPSYGVPTERPAPPPGAVQGGMPGMMPYYPGQPFNPAAGPGGFPTGAPEGGVVF